MTAAIGLLLAAAVSAPIPGILPATFEAADGDLQFESPMIDFGAITIGSTGDGQIVLVNARPDPVTDLAISIETAGAARFTSWQPAYPCSDGTLATGAPAISPFRSGRDVGLSSSGRSAGMNCVPTALAVGPA